MFLRIFVTTTLLCLLAACGGGGGGGNDGGVPPPSNSPTGSFTLASNTVTLTARTDQQAATSSGSIAMHVNDVREVAAVGAAYVAPNQPASWLNVDIRGSGADYSVIFNAAWPNLAPGIYTAVVSIGTGKADGTILQRRDVTVTLTVVNISIVAEFGTFGGRMTLGDSDSTRAFNVHVNAPPGRSWTVSSSGSWLRVPSTIYTGAADVPVQMISTGLTVRDYSAQLTFLSQSDPLDFTTRTVSLLVVAPELVLLSNGVTLGGADGNDSSQGWLRAILLTGTNTYPMTLTPMTTSGGAWLTGGSATGTIGGSETMISLSANPAVAPAGSYDGVMTVDVNVLGHIVSRSVQVHYNQDENRLIAATLGASFSKFPTRSVLGRRIRISDSLGRTDVPWSASDDAPWLTVTANGTTGGEVELHANPSGLAADQLYLANVTVTSSSPRITNDQRIRVALWVGSTDPTDATFAQTVISMIANPVEPHVYLSLPGGAIEVRNVYTGALVTSYSPGTPDIMGLQVSDDGRTLFAVDGWVDPRVIALDPQTGAVVGEYDLTQQYTTTLHYMRPNARPVLISGGGQVFDVASRAELASRIALDTYYPTNHFAHTSDHRFVYSQLRGISPSRLEKGRIAYSTLFTPRLVAEHLAWSAFDDSGGMPCVSPDDARILTAGSRYGQPFNLLNSADLSVASRFSAPPSGASNFACLWNGLYLGTTNGDPPADTYFFDAQGTEIARSVLYQTYHAPMPDRVVVSGDASRLVGVTGGPSFHLNFRNAPLVP